MASLVVPCPKCATKLSAPDSAVGKQIRCPKCGALATVPNLLPAEVVPVVEATVSPPRLKPKPLQAEVADDDDEDDRPRKKKQRDEEEADDDRPRKKKRRDEEDYAHDKPRKKARRKSGGGALVAGLVIGGLLLLAGIAFAVYLLAGKGSPLVKKSPVPAGWEEHNYPQDGFKLYLPKGASYTSVPTDGFRPGGFGGRGRFGAGGFDIADDLPPVDRFALVSAGEWNDSARIELYVIKFRDKVPSSVRDQIRKYSTNGKFGGVEMRTVKWLGHDALEQVHTNGVMRIVYTERHFVMATVNGPNTGRAKPEEEAGFFDNLELTN